MNKPLSPAAQAVIKKVQATLPDYMISDRTAGLFTAAALRAVSDRTECLIGDNPHPKFVEGVLAAGDLLERIAAELEGPNG
jgi:hypothetical protein